MPRLPTDGCPGRPACRRGFVRRGMYGVLTGVAVVGLALLFASKSSSQSAVTSGFALHKAERGEFVHEITERGEVQSASNVEIRCEVQSRGVGGTTILEIIPEGTYVKSGDLLVRLDSSDLETQLNQQQIVCNNSQADVVKAKNDLEVAQIGKLEYLEGTFVQLEEAAKAKILVAKEDHDRSVDAKKYSEGLFTRGYITKLQLLADTFAVEKALLTQSAAETELRVLQKYTKPKMLTQFETAINTAAAKYDAVVQTHKLDLEKLNLVQTQVDKCTIRAENNGQVVYANSGDRRAGNEVIIEEGTTVREHQVIVRLPDPTNMQVNAKINEAKVSMVAAGQSARIRMDAYPDQELTGKVEKVSEYPAPTGWFNSNVKEYETIIHIDQPPPGMRPGLTAEVKILVSRMDKVLQVPVQTVIEHGDQHYCLLPHGNPWEARLVELGPTNDKYVVIRDGLQEGEEVVMGALSFRDKSALPKLAETPAAAKGKGKGTRPAVKGPVTGPLRPEPGGPKKSPGELADQPSPAERFRALDKNHDGNLIADEVDEKTRKRFPSIDNNGDGKINAAEWTIAARKESNQQSNQREPGKPSAGTSP
jgi:HlyD family secretion protein